MKEELKARLDELQKHQESTQQQIDELKKQIEEAEKPKLRHGDYGFGATDSRISRVERLYLKDEDGGDIISHDWYCFEDDGYHPLNKGNAVIIGNIFDELKAMQEDVTEFETTDDGWKEGYIGSTKTKAYICYGNDISIFHELDGKTVSQFFSPRGLGDYIKKLQAMYATAQRRKK